MMSHTRHQQLLSGASTLARKVYEHVPVTEGWTHTRIHQEYQTNGRTCIALNVLQGCLAQLRSAGLVYEPTPGTFQRVAHKAPLVALRDLRLVRNDPAPHEPEAAPTLPLPESSTVNTTNIDTIRMAKALVEGNGYICLLKADFDKDQEAFVKLDDELKALKQEHAALQETHQGVTQRCAHLALNNTSLRGDIERLQQEIERLKVARAGDQESMFWKNIGFDFEADFKALKPYETKPYQLPKGRTMSAMQQAARAGAQRAMNGETGWMDSFVEEGSVLVVVRRKTRSTAREQLSLKAA